MIAWLKGKKTYIVTAVIFTIAGLAAIGIETPQWVYGLLTALGLGFSRAGSVKTK